MSNPFGDDTGEEDATEETEESPQSQGTGQAATGNGSRDPERGSPGPSVTRSRLEVQEEYVPCFFPLRDCPLPGVRDPHGGSIMGDYWQLDQRGRYTENEGRIHDLFIDDDNVI